MISYKSGWNGGVFTCVSPQFTSQYCSACGLHPKDDVKTKHIAHGRINRGSFVCPLCKYKEDADINAARNILAKCRPFWVELRHPQQVKNVIATGTVVSARRAQ